MSSLKEKAKTKREIWNEPDIIQKPETSVDTLWVRLEDAQQEIDRLEKQIEKEIMIRCGYSEQIVELKQKLQQLLNEFPDATDEKYKLPDAWTAQDIVDTYTMLIKDVFGWKKKFRELLKEEKANTNV